MYKQYEAFENAEEVWLWYCACLEARRDVSNISDWLAMAAQMGETGLSAVNLFETAKWLGRTLNVPAVLINETPDVSANGGQYE